MLGPDPVATPDAPIAETGPLWALSGTFTRATLDVALMAVTETSSRAPAPPLKTNLVAWSRFSPATRIIPPPRTRRAFFARCKPSRRNRCRSSGSRRTRSRQCRRRPEPPSRQARKRPRQARHGDNNVEVFGIGSAWGRSGSSSRPGVPSGREAGIVRNRPGGLRTSPRNLLFFPDRSGVRMFARRSFLQHRIFQAVFLRRDQDQMSKTYVATPETRNRRMGRRRRRGSDPGPSRDADRGHAPWQEQAGVHAAHRHRRLRGRDQRREDQGHRQQADREDLLPPHRLPRWTAQPHPRGAARASSRGSHPQGRQGHDSAHQAGPRSAAAS